MKKVFALLFVIGMFICASTQAQVIINDQVSKLQEEAFKLNYALGQSVINTTPKSGENTEAYITRLQNEISYQKQVIDMKQNAYNQGHADAQREVRQNNGGGLIVAGVAGLIIGSSLNNNYYRYNSYGNRVYYGNPYGGYGYSNYGGYVPRTYYSPNYGRQRMYYHR